MKRLFVLVLCALMLMGLTACNDGGSEKPLVDKINTVGVVQLLKHDALDAATQGFKDELEKEFSNIVIDVKLASGEPANCATIVNGFVNDGVDLIMANATPALQAAVAATGDIPILGTSITEYGVALGIEDFNGLVGENVSGTSDLAPLDEQAQMIIDLIPDVKTVGIIYSSDEPNSAYQVKVVTEYLESKGVAVIAEPFTESNDISLTTAELCDAVDAVYIPTDNKAASYAETINNVTLERKIPVICGEEGTCIKCGIATLTINYYDLGVETGKMAARILKGEANIEEMPIQYFPNPVKKYNKEIADTLGIAIPEDYIAID